MRTKKLFLLAFILVFVSSGFAFAQKTEAISFFNHYNRTIISSQKKMTLMNRPKNIAKLGKETVRGNYGGTVFYHAEIKGLGAKVLIRYADYSDERGFVISGNQISNVKMDASGAMAGTMVVKDIQGNELGRICYDKLLIIDGNAGGGGYIVTLPGCPAVFLRWDEVIPGPSIKCED